jgi:hypothetical protein
VRLVAVSAIIVTKGIVAGESASPRKKGHQSELAAQIEIGQKKLPGVHIPDQLSRLFDRGGKALSSACAAAERTRAFNRSASALSEQVMHSGSSSTQSWVSAPHTVQGT